MLFICLLVCLFIVGCGKDNESEKSDAQPVHVNIEDYKLLIEPNNTLGFSLLDKVDSDEKGNIFISPSSALIALLMAYNGADGETKQEMETALSIDGFTVDEINKANLALMNMLEKNSDSIELSMANSIWLNEEYHFTSDFKKKVIDYFNGEIAEINVFDNVSVNRINNWVNDSTNGKIEEIIEAPLHPDMVALLVNAIYFNGKWTHEFNEANTENSIFHAPDGDKDTPFMMLEEELEYMENEMVQAVKLPYGKGELNMQVVLPKEGDSLDELIDSLLVDDWSGWQTEFQETNGIIKLPKFQVEYETILNESLTQLGINKAFNEKEADFSHMIEEEDPLWIHKVKQKTFINVNEEGAEAGAATSVEMRTTSAIVGEDFYMEVNRPFLFTISLEDSNTILFIGLISSPEQE